MDYNEEYQNTFTLIENNVFYDLELSNMDIRVYGCVRSLACNGKGYCFASNDYISKKIGFSVSHIKRSLKTLADKGYIKTEIFYKENSKEVAQRRIRTFTLTNEFNYKTLEQTGSYMNPPQLLYEPTPQLLYEPDNNTSINNTRVIKKEIYKERKENEQPAEEKSVDFSSMQKEAEEQIILSEFEKFWKVYPRKTDKTMARKRYLTALKNNDVTYETILKGAENYKAYTETEKQDEKFIKHAATWLNNKCWENEYKINSFNEKKEIILPESIRGKHLYEMNYEEQQLYYSVVDKYL